MSKKTEQLIVVNDNQLFPIGAVLSIIKHTKKLQEYKVVWAKDDGEYSLAEVFVHKYCKPYKKEKEGAINIMDEYMGRGKKK